MIQQLRAMGGRRRGVHLHHLHPSTSDPPVIPLLLSTGMGRRRSLFLTREWGLVISFPIKLIAFKEICQNGFDLTISLSLLRIGISAVTLYMTISCLCQEMLLFLLLTFETDKWWVYLGCDWEGSQNGRMSWHCEAKHSTYFLNVCYMHTKLRDTHIQ